MLNKIPMCYTLKRKNKDKLNLNKKQENTKLLLKKDLEKNDFDFVNMLGWPHYPNYCYATVIDDKIVSCASAGYRADKIADKIVDITVRTHENYRRKGYSVSNTVALCEYILNMHEEKEIQYITDSKNIASQKTALSAGLIRVPYCYFLVNKLKCKIFKRR